MPGGARAPGCLGARRCPRVLGGRARVPGGARVPGCPGVPRGARGCPGVLGCPCARVPRCPIAL